MVIAIDAGFLKERCLLGGNDLEAELVKPRLEFRFLFALRCQFSVEVSGGLAGLSLKLLHRCLAISLYLAALLVNLGRERIALFFQVDDLKAAEALELATQLICFGG